MGGWVQPSPPVEWENNESANEIFPLSVIQPCYSSARCIHPGDAYASFVPRPPSKDKCQAVAIVIVLAFIGTRHRADRRLLFTLAIGSADFQRQRQPGKSGHLRARRDGSDRWRPEAGDRGFLVEHRHQHYRYRHIDDAALLSSFQRRHDTVPPGNQRRPKRRDDEWHRAALSAGFRHIQRRRTKPRVGRPDHGHFREWPLHDAGPLEQAASVRDEFVYRAQLDPCRKGRLQSRDFQQQRGLFIHRHVRRNRALRVCDLRRRRTS